MIPCSEDKLQPVSWQMALKDLLTDIDELVALIPSLSSMRNILCKVGQEFPLRIPRGYLKKILKLPHPEPLLLQYLPDPNELAEIEGYERDPLREAEANQLPGLLHKYQGRALLSVTQSCAVHCRYCFRRHFNYRDNNPGKSGWEKVFDYLQEDASLREVILSGGDPLSLSDNHLSYFLEAINAIPHVEIIRFHTRFPVILPERISISLLNLLKKVSKKIVFVLHINHPDEIDDVLADALQKLIQQGVILLNQSVLLKGVNDSTNVLVELSYRLIGSGIVPYYLHVLDKIQGAHHFAVPDCEAQKLHQALHAQCAGYLVPKLVREIPGHPGKTLISTVTV